MAATARRDSSSPGAGRYPDPPMKDTILPGLHVWSVLQEQRRIDFNGFFWRRENGGVLIDPMPLAAWQAEFVDAHGGARWILLTNADHWRATSELRARFSASVWVPEVERERLGARAVEVDGWFAASGQLPDALRADVEVLWVRGGKSPAEAVLHLLPPRALVFGDVVRSDASGALRLLDDGKLTDRAQVVRDVLALRDVNQRAILLGDGDPLWTGSRGAFLDFLRELGTAR